jgi:transposase
VAKRYRPVERDQRFLLPPDMREWLPADHVVWFLLEVITELDTAAFHVRPRRADQGPATGSAAGRAGYDPDMLLGLLIYAYACGETSSRQIERHCHTDVAFRVLCADDIPDHTVIARFRGGHQERFSELFAQVLRLCARAGLGQVGTVAIDGSKFAGDASMSANHSRDWFARQAAERTEAAAAADAAEDALFGEDGTDGGGDRVPGGWGGPGGYRARIRACLDDLDSQLDRAQGDASGEVAKAEARVAAREADVARLRAEQQAKLDKWNGQWVKYRERPTYHRPPWGPIPKPVDEAVRVRNAERALTRARDHAERKTRRAHELTAPRSGSTDLVPVGAGPVEPAEHDSKTLVKRGTRGPVRNLTDPDSRLMSGKRGWVQGYNAQFAVTADQLVLAVQVTQDPVDNPWFIPMINVAVAAATDLAAARDPDTAPGEHGGIGMILADAGYNSDANLTAPGPDRLIALGKSRAHHRAAREDPAHGDPPPEATAREAMDHRLRTPQGHATYKRRGATVEPGIGNIKKIVPTLTRRGLAAATGEITLAAIVHNLRKLHRATLTATT